MGYDVPDFVATKAPTDPGGKDPFIMRVDGKGGLFAPLNEGPFPEHYEPVETPVEKNPFSSRMHNPVVKIWKTDAGKSIGDNWGKPKEFPIVATTYRVVEHWQAGGMSRWLEWLTECQPEMFIEMSKELAKEKRHSKRRTGEDSLGPRRDPGGRDRNGALQAVSGGRENRSSDRNALAFRLGRSRQRRRSPTT